jgi:hypothetical protein
MPIQEMCKECVNKCKQTMQMDFCKKYKKKEK